MGVPRAAVTQWQAAFLLDEAARGIEATPANAVELAAALLPGGALTPHPAKPYIRHCPPTRDLYPLHIYCETGPALAPTVECQDHLKGTGGPKLIVACLCTTPVPTHLVF